MLTSQLEKKSSLFNVWKLAVAYEGRRNGIRLRVYFDCMALFNLICTYNYLLWRYYYTFFFILLPLKCGRQGWHSNQRPCASRQNAIYPLEPPRPQLRHSDVGEIHVKDSTKFVIRPNATLHTLNSLLCSFGTFHYNTEFPLTLAASLFKSQ